MEMTEHNFDQDQAGMKQQLRDVQQLIALLDQGFTRYLEANDCQNMYFCFRWLLVLFKREFCYNDVLRLWEVLWTEEPCQNFHLLIGAALLENERDMIMENKFGLSEILKHVNDLAYKHDLDSLLKKAESIYNQISASPDIPAEILELLGLPVPPKAEDSSPSASAGSTHPSSPMKVTDCTGSDGSRSRITFTKDENFVSFRSAGGSGSATHSSGRSDAVVNRQPSGSSVPGSAVVSPTGSNKAEYRHVDNDPTSGSLVGTVTHLLGTAVRQLTLEEDLDDNAQFSMNDVDSIIDNSLSSNFY